MLACRHAEIGKGIRMKRIVILAIGYTAISAFAAPKVTQLKCYDPTASNAISVWNVETLENSDRFVGKAQVYEVADKKLSSLFLGGVTPTNINVERQYDDITQQILIDRFTLEMTQINWSNNQKEAEKVFKCTLGKERRF
jgi:hypothetical protein